MNLTYLKRRSGKTTRAIRECRKTGAVLVVRDASMKRWIITGENWSPRLPEKQIITFDELMRGADRLRGIQYPTQYGLPEFIIDDADHFLQQLLPYGFLRRVTMSRPFTKADCKKYGMPLDMVGRT